VITETTTFTATNLLSDGAVSAAKTDPQFINPWGVSSFQPGGPFWISDNNSGNTTVVNATTGTPINVAGNPTPEVTIAPAAGQTTAAAPTGQVFNAGGTGFVVSQGGKSAPSAFLFATEDGTISGWNPSVNPSQSVLAIDNSQGSAGAVYKGLAIGTTASGTFLYAANFRGGTVDMFDQNFKQVGGFTDPNLPAGFAPFNVQNLGGHLFVTFALQDAAKHDDVAGSGNGFVDEFDLSGNLVRRIASGGVLNSPWGLAIAPAGFGRFAGDLLVGNFGDGTVNAFNATSGAFQGTLTDANGNPIREGDLWAVMPGTGGAGGDPNTVYFTAGVQAESHGLFGSLTANNTIAAIGGNNLVPLGSGTNLVRSSGADTIIGSSGADTIVAKSNASLVFGGSDRLLFIGGAGMATVVGGASSSVFGGAGGVDAFGNAGGGVFAGGSRGGNLIVAGTQASTIFGGGAGDTLFANGAGGDVLVAAGGNETLSGGIATGNNMIFGGTGGDLLVAGAGADTLVAGTGNSTLVGGRGADLLIGSSASDVLVAGAESSNTLVGGSGAATFIAGNNAQLRAGAGADMFLFASGHASGHDSVIGFGAKDRIALQGFGSSAAVIAGQMNSGGNTTITLSHNTTVTFVGVAHLSAGDFA
jgi:uncharacterized protein (TIGR03118 family)